MRKLSILLLMLILCLTALPIHAETDGDFAYSVIGGKAIITAYTGGASELTVPDTLGGYPVTSIRYCAFRECSTLTRVTLPRGVTSIGSNAFQHCASLSQLILPDSLKTIGTHAFYGCSNLAQLAIPDNIECFQGYPFYGSSAVRICSLYGQAARVLTDFGYTFTCPEYPFIALTAHNSDGLRTFTVADCDESALSVDFPAGTNAIERYAFFGCAALEEVSLPDGVSEIPESAFEGCSLLRQITIPGSVKKIAESAFARCGDLTIIAPEGSAGQAFAEENGFIWQEW